MAEKRIQFNNIVQNQIPGYVKDEFPLVAEFFKSYYQGQEYQSGPLDLIQNIDQYTKVDELTSLTTSVVLNAKINQTTETITVDLQESPTGTRGFPDSYGLLKIEDEIISYTGKTDSSFTGCIRGFSGVTSYHADAKSDALVFKTSNSYSHDAGSTITNLSVLFLKEFLLKTKRQLIPGFDDRELHKDLKQNTFIKQAKDFYLSKGSDKSFEILFKALYNEEVKIVRPKQFLFTPSNAHYLVTNDLVVEPISGDPLNLENSTLFQEPYGDSIEKAYAPVTNIEPIEVGYGKTYYKLSIDGGYNRDIRVDGALYGQFSVQPKTRIIGQVAAGTSTLNVDSTVGFAQTGGDLYLEYSDGTIGIVSYSSKSLTQFFGVGVASTGVQQEISNAQSIGINTFAYGQSFKDQDETITVRINGVLSKFDYAKDNRYYSKDDTVKIKTLGVSDSGFKAKNWFYNNSPIYKVKSLELVDSSDQTYKLTLNVDHYFRLGDGGIIISSNDTEKYTQITDIPSSKTIIIKGQGNLDISDIYTIRRNILTAETSTYPEAKIYSTNIQNVYKSGTDLLVASSSIPTYNSQPLNVSTQTVTFSGDFVGSEFEISPSKDHGFYTGDAVYYLPEKIAYEYYNSLGVRQTGLIVNSSLFASDISYVIKGVVGSETFENRIPPNEGLYFIYRVNENTVKLARSRTDLYNSEFISLDNSVSVTDCKIKPYDFRHKTLESQKLLREISNPDDDGTVTETEPGFTGILINGVEICNYKSKDSIHYGKITDIEVVSPGSGYDVINVPLLNIGDSVGTGATGYVSVNGNFEEIRILDSGFDYKDTPVVSITGGNGTGAVAKVNMKEVVHSVSFNSQSDVVLGSTAYNAYQIGFSTYHKFNSSEKVIYTNQGQTPVGGITTDSTYYVSVVGVTTVKLHKTQQDAIVGINTVELTSFGVGKQYLQSYDPKSVVEAINITNSGSGYENKKTSTLSSSGISTSLNEITINKHGYDSGEIVNYVETTDTVIGGLSVDTEYYVTKVNDNKFKLSNVGLGTTNKDFYYRTNQYIDFTSVGVGTHLFNYPDISVKVIGTVGISSIGTETFECKVQPIVRGEIGSIHLSNNGVGYGSSEILNFIREPEINLISGEDAQLSPIVVDGVITEVIVMNSGQKYNCAPILTVNGDGVGAVLTPVFENNQITAVNVIHGGVNYTSSTTTVIVTFPGLGVKVRPHLKEWQVNLFEKNISQVTGDDGYIPHEFTTGLGLQYSHLYAPRKLRESVYATNQEGQSLYGSKDLKRVNGLEVASIDHSPIIGWAYDGNPIYGPYGYITQSGGIISQMISGYTLDLQSGRPPVTLFPEGFFVEDYTYKKVSNETTLDENNGRFCITPDYPEGTYAYFATINESSVDSSGPFAGFKRPVFPYLVGENYKSIPNKFNFEYSSHQHSTILENSKWKRNTAPYNLIEGDLEYEYAYIPNKLSQTIDIKAVNPGGIENVGIITGGDSYQIGDSAVFDNNNTQGLGAIAKVSQLDGKSVSNISVASSSITGVEIYPSEKKGTYLLVCDNPHNFKDKDTITISGLSTTSSNIGGVHKIGVTTSRFVVTGVGTEDSTGIAATGATGLVTYFSVTGNLTYPNIEVNDILGIGTERVKVLNVEPKLSRIRVLRAVDGTIGVSHTVTSFLFQDQRKLTVNTGFKTTYSYKRNEQIYFKPSESVGLGTTSGVGIGSTLYFSNPGTGISEIFIQTKAIYIPGHNLRTGDKLTYSPNNSSTNSGLTVLEQGASYPAGVSTLTDGQTVYAARISDSLIGLSTVRVGLGSTGTFVGIASTHQSSTTLYFTKVGVGSYHSFKTNYEPITAQIERHLVTVSAASSHGLTNNDEVDVTVTSNISTSFVVKYNDYNRRVVITPKSFAASGVNTSTNSFTITDHEFVTGQKIIYTSDSPIEGLEDNGIYYVVSIDSNTFKLSDTYYNSTLQKPIIVGISSTSSGVINPINPPLKVYRDATISFDVSDSSLSYTNQATQYSAYELNFYTDNNLTNVWNKSLADKDFNVTRTGTTGISADAAVTLSVTGNIPEVLYYNLDPLYENELPVIKKEISVDNSVIDRNQILTKASVYNGKQVITTASTTAFTYTLSDKPEQVSYAGTITDVEYQTTSTSAYGPISQFDIKSPGRNYYSLPGITTVTSTVGTGAVAEPSSASIGKIKKVKIEDIGYNFPSDTTLEPSALLPQILDIESLASFNSIGIASGGRGYAVAPKLLVRDGRTKKIITDADLKYTLGDTHVTILKNPTGMSKAYIPTLIPYENSNGVGISTVGFNTITKDAFVSLSVGFSTANVFPFVVGDKVMIENVSIGVGSTGKGYNSADWDYTLFTVNAVDKNLGGIGATIAYSMSDQYPDSGTFPGTFDPNNSAGRIIPEKYFPQFDISLGTNDYLGGETVTSDSASGTVESWNEKIGVLKVSSSQNFVVGEVVKGSTSNCQGLASSIRSFDSEITLDSLSRVEKGWETDSGVLNYNMQRLQDSFYYQNFSYALNSRVTYDTWNDVVGSLNHTLGFKKFSDYQLETTNSPMVVGVSTELTSVDIVTDMIGYGDLNCVYDFDLVTENSLNLGSSVFSDEVIFASRILMDYQESVGNRVLTIDDMSASFNSHPRATKYSTADSFRIADIRAQKYLTYVVDKRYTQQRQLMWVTLLHDSSFGYMNQYGRIETQYDQGSFDFMISGSEGYLLFYPTKSSVNDYDITTLAYNLDDNYLGIGSTALGGIVDINTSSTKVPSGTQTTVVGIASTYRSVKVLVEITPDAGGDGETINTKEWEFTELNVIHDGSTVDLLEYGELTTTQTGYSDPGFGTFYPYISGKDLKVDFIPNSGIGTTCVVNTIQVAISSESSSGIATVDLNHAQIVAKATSISASATPIAVPVAEYSDDYDCAYFISQVSDTTNNRYQMSELLVVDNYIADPSDAVRTSDTEYGVVVVNDHSELGIFSTGISGFGTSYLYFQPNANIACEVKTYMNALKNVVGAKDEIDFTNATITSGLRDYYGTERDIKRAFNLTHDTYNIFERYFLANDAEIVSVANNTITVPNHFWVTGENITYKHVGTAASGIGIAATDGFAGVGETTFLPDSLFVVKINEDTIKIAETAEKALKIVPETVDITSVGIGTSHVFISKNQNAKALLALDNIIQSPVVSTAVTSTLSNMVYGVDNILEFSGIGSFFGADLIRVGSGDTTEIMKIEGVGIGSTNYVRVRREWLGSTLLGFGTGDLITKIDGNYNIVNNVLTFAEAPYGNIPLSSTTNPPDSRDWVGIATGSSFQGRTFMRSGETDSSNETYSENVVFDSISSKFNGIENTFALESNGSAVTGIQTDTVILVNDVFQGNGSTYDYTITQTGSASSISFTGTATSLTSDPGGSNLPMGGVIVSVGSSGGMGYQPLVAAGGTAIVGVSGTVSSISLGYTGSGYRSGIQTVNVSIQQKDLIGTNIIAIGTAIVKDGHVTGTAVTNPHVFYSPRTIANVGYTHSTGVSTVTTATPHGLSLGDEVQLSGIAFTCNYSPRLAISTAAYNNVTGVMTVTTVGNHGYKATGKTSQVIFTGLAFTCGVDGGTSTHYYPRGQDLAYDTAVPITKDGTSYTVTNAVYNPVTGITTLTINNHGFGNGEYVKLNNDSLTFACAKDNYATRHTYPRSTDPIAGEWVSIANTTTNTFEVQVLSVAPSTNTSAHSFVSASPDGLTHNDGNITFNVGYSGGADQYTHTFVGVGTSAVLVGGDYAHQFVSAATSAVTAGGDYTHTFISVGVGTITVVGIGSTVVTDASYTASSGELELTVGSGHTYTTDNVLGIATNALIFTCSLDGNTSYHSYPRTTDPIISLGTTAITATTDTTITVNVGSSPLSYFDVSDATYSGETGELTLTVGSHSLTGPSTHTVTYAEYNPVSGMITCAVGTANSFAQGDKIKFNNNSLTFTCAQDAHATNHTYPRASDPVSGKWLTVTGIGTTTFEVQVLDTIPSTNTGVHTFVSATTGGLIKAGSSVKLKNDSLTFRCALDDYATLHTYPRYSDPGFSTALGITSTTSNTISINVGISTIVKWDVTSANYNPVSGIMTVGIGTTHRLRKGSSIKIATESLTFTCAKDGNATTHRYPRKPDPYYGGTPITSLNSATQFEVNIGTSDHPTFYVGLGSVQAAILAPRESNNSTSKFDTALNGSIVLDVIDNYSFLTNVGISTLQHYYARGGTLSKPLDVLFDDPLSYSNLPLYYGSNYSGVGTNATIDVVVGQGSSIVEFRIDETGYGYGNGEFLTVPFGGTTGIPTTSSYREFLIEINETFSDEFTGWSIGLLQMLDNWDSKFDGTTQTFQLTENGGDLISIRSRKGSKINVQNVLLIFINDILQVPGEGYTFDGGSIVTFTEAPKEDDTSKVIFYKGSGAADVIDREIIETVKKGDNLTIESNYPQAYYLQEDKRSVLRVDSTDVVSSNPYYGPGNTADETLLRPVVWCRQTEDMIIDELPIGKDRELYEPQIAPFGYITKSVGIGSTTIYVDQLRPLFDPYNEKEDKTTLGFQKKVKFFNQAVKVGAAGTAIISGLGTISSVAISTGGVGYTTATVSFASTVGIGTTTQAYGNVTIGAGGTVAGIAITAPGVGYTFTESWQQQIVISPPTFVEETNSVGSYSGDQGVIVGFGTTTTGSDDQMIFDFYIPQDSFLREGAITGTAITMSGIGTNDVFVVTGSNVGDGTTSITSVDSGSNTVGVGTSFIDNVYSVSTYEIVNRPSAVNSSGVGIGTTYCTRVFTTISSDFSWGGSGIETSNYYGTFSWGRIDLTSRAGLNSYTAYTEGGVTGITTSTIVERFAPLRYKSYDQI